jgi:hypothetical protein
MSGTVQGKRGPLAVSRGRADFRNHGATHGRSRRRAAGYPVLGRGSYVAAERNDPDVFADERLQFATLAEAHFEPAKAVPAGRVRTSQSCSHRALAAHRRRFPTQPLAGRYRLIGVASLRRTQAVDVLQSVYGSVREFCERIQYLCSSSRRPIVRAIPLSWPLRKVCEVLLDRPLVRHLIPVRQRASTRPWPPTPPVASELLSSLACHVPNFLVLPGRLRFANKKPDRYWSAPRSAKRRFISRPEIGYVKSSEFNNPRGCVFTLSLLSLIRYMSWRGVVQRSAPCVLGRLSSDTTRRSLAGAFVGFVRQRALAQAATSLR